jgi:hypothetical protein
MTTTLTMNDRLIELGVLGDQKDKAIQRKGATLVDAYFMSFTESDVDDETTALVLHYLTDIQVRDFALGIIDKYKNVLPALNYLLDKAPTDTAFINAPAALLATYLYERGDSANAAITLSNAQPFYNLSALLRRVMTAGWQPSEFAKMRAVLHPKVVAGIFGEEEQVCTQG